MFHKQHNTFNTPSVSPVNLDLHPIVPVLDDSIITDSSDFLDNIKNSEGVVEFFNSFYTQDWFSSKYCPVRRRDFVLQKFSDSHPHFTEHGRSSYVSLYFDRLMIQNRIPHNVLGSFVCLPTIPLTKTRAELENYIHSLNLPGFKELVLSEPLQKIKMRRLGWFIFDSIEHAKNAVENSDKIESNDEFVPHLLPAKESNRNVKIVDESFDDELRKRFDLLVVAKVYYTISIELSGNDKADTVKLVSSFLKYLKKETNKLNKTNKENSYSLIDTLTFFVDTVRNFYSFCYYCGRFFLSKDEMFARCGRVHIRNNFTNRWKDVLDSIKTYPDNYNAGFNNNNNNNVNDNDNSDEKEEGEEESYQAFKEKRAGFGGHGNNDNNTTNNYYFINTPETCEYRLPEDNLYLTKEEEALILDPDRLIETNFFDLAVLAKQSEKPEQEEGELNDNDNLGGNNNNYNSNVNEDIKQLVSKTERQNILNTKLRSHFETVNEKIAKEPNWQALTEKLKTDEAQSTDSANRKVTLNKLLFNRKRYGLIRFYKEFKETWAVDNLKKCIIEETDKCFICCFCSKRFGGREFINKHVINKHEDEIEDMLRELYFREYFLNYYRDDMRLGEKDFIIQVKHFHR
eukprot:GAHX01000688.1.p1 GENE.GAHX01000688.1~~GAHX01000688.1.p1  ORF type:complete len:627 (-),score=126.63 GAHX01000688.1:46-1926(-)